MPVANDSTVGNTASRLRELGLVLLGSRALRPGFEAEGDHRPHSGIHGKRGTEVDVPGHQTTL
jgi:hypothetical protein